MRIGNLISDVLEGLWQWTWSVDRRNRVALCKKGNWRLLDEDSKLKSIKKRGKISIR